MFRPLVLAALVVALLVGCARDDDDGGSEGSSDRATVAATQPGEASPTAGATETGGGSLAETATARDDGPYSAAAVWDAISGDNPPRDLLDKLRGCQMPNTDCIVRVMQDGGASTDAIAFFTETGWFLVGFREMGTVDLGRILLPWRANALYQYYLMNGEPPLVSPEEEGARLSFAADPAYPRLTDAVTAAGIPPTPVALAIFPADDYYESTTDRGDGGKRFVFQYTVVNVCHACGTGYFERVGFDFDGGGRYLSASLIELCRSSAARLDVAGVEACPATSR